MDPIPAPIVIEPDAGANPITGRVRSEPQPARASAGWTGLFGALRAAAGEQLAEQKAGPSNPLMPGIPGRGTER
jgi:hypothetical protein